MKTLLCVMSAVCGVVSFAPAEVDVKSDSGSDADSTAAHYGGHKESRIGHDIGFYVVENNGKHTFVKSRVFLNRGVNVVSDERMKMVIAHCITSLRDCSKFKISYLNGEEVKSVPLADIDEDYPNVTIEGDDRGRPTFQVTPLE